MRQLDETPSGGGPMNRVEFWIGSVGLGSSYGTWVLDVPELTVLAMLVSAVGFGMLWARR